MSNVLCITGMHRSGTSLVSSWLQSCGLVIDNGNLMEGGVGNIKGHFEDLDFVNLHASALMRSYNSSKGWIANVGNLSFSENEIERARTLVEERSKFDQWGWKDPRSVFFLGDWLNLISETKFIFLWRPASDVVNSLINRSKKSNNNDIKINRCQAYQLWVRSNHEILKFLNQNRENSILVNTETLFKKDQAFFEELKERWHLNLEYSDIQNLVEPSLFISKPQTSLDKIFSKLFGIQRYEQILLENSYH
jgi:hypothetical protein